MKNLKIALTTLVAIIILTISTGAFAYTGVGDVDPEYSIKMGSELNNGVASVSGASDFSYQFVEISEAKYNTIKRLEAEFDLIQVYVTYTSDIDHEVSAKQWEDAQAKFASIYGQGKEAAAVATEVLNKYGIGPDILTLCRNAWIVELTDFDANKWEKSTDNKLTLDLTKFTGTKYFIGWINTGSVYDAEVYKVVGTGAEQEPATTDKKEETKNETKKEATPIKTNKSTESTLPHTGVSDVIVALIATASVATGVSYIKYRKIK